MSNLFSVNNMNYMSLGWSSTTSAGNTDAMFYAWKTFMVSAGWTVIASGDGTGGTLYSSGTKDIFTSAYKGVAGGLGNNKSWFILQEPATYAGSQRQFLIFKNNNTTAIANNDYRYIMYSHQGFDLTAGHNSSAVSASNPPIAYDEILVHSSGTWTDNVPSNFFNLDVAGSTTEYNSYNNWGIYYNSYVGFPQTIYHFYASSSAPFSFYILVTTTQSWENAEPSPVCNEVTRFFCFDELSEYTPGIVDPVVICNYSDNQFGSTGINIGSTVSAVSAYFSNMAWENKRVFTSKADSISATSTSSLDIVSLYSPIAAMIKSDISTVAQPTYSTALNNPCSNKTTVSPILWSYSGYNNWYMGKSNIFKYSHVNYPFPTTFSVSIAKDNITLGYNITNLGSLLIPWDGTSRILTGC